MDKVRKQMIINLLIVLTSAAVIVLAKSIPAGELLPWGSYLGSDIVFTVISSLVGTMGWRYVENIHSWGWDLFSIIALLFFAVFYGAAMVNVNDLVKILIQITLGLFLFMYVCENRMIYRYFEAQEKAKEKGRNQNYVGYNKRSHND